jgi:transcriptional regulator with XRE-family HTH domain
VPKAETSPLSRSRLAAERYRRGWSQQEVADRIGTTPLNVSRWERGLTKPSPYFRYKLSQVFEVNAQALGILPETTDQFATEDELFMGQKGEGIYDPALPLPLKMIPLIGRDEVFERIQQRLLAAQGVPSIAISGLPGIGKTALAVKIAYDYDVRRQFTEGILWASLGPEADLHGILQRWGILLGISASEMATPEACFNALNARIGQQRFLVILDNVWHLQDAWYCLVGEPQCAYVLTTCFPQIAQAYAKDSVLALHELSAEDSFRFVQYLAPEAVEKEPEQVSTLIEKVGGLPLGLTLIGNYLRFHSHNGQPRRLRSAFASLNDTQARLRLTDTRLFSDRSASIDPVSLEMAIAVIDRHLDREARRALRALSAFPPKPESFSEEAALAVCQLPAEVLDTLSDVGLLESVEPGRYVMHRVVSDYARLCLAKDGGGQVSR